MFRPIAPVLACVLSLFMASTLWAAPGPGALLDAQPYDVTIYRSGQGAAYTGQFVFNGDPQRPQLLELGTWTFALTPAAGDGATGDGNWVSLSFFFVDFWLGLASTDTDGSVLVYGIAWDDEIYGKAGLFDANLNSGFYRMFGNFPLPEIPEVPEIPEIEEEETADEMTEETM